MRSVRVAESDTEACALLDSLKPDIIILDINLPDIDGVEVLKFLDKHQKHHHVKIILNSCLQEDDERLIEALNYNIYANFA